MASEQRRRFLLVSSRLRTATRATSLLAVFLCLLAPGAMPSASAAYRIRLPAGTVAVGVATGYGRFLTQGELEDVNIEVIPIGADARYEIGDVGSLLIYFRAAAGPALLRFQPAEGGWLTKLVPFALVGIGVGIPLAGPFGLTFETSYSIYLEKDNPIMGFTPAVGTYVRWRG